MIKVAAITSGKNVPSSRFRVRQHIEDLGLYGVHVKEYCPAISKYHPLPIPEKYRNQPYTFPLHVIWKLMKLSTRLPAVLGSYSADVVWLERELSPNISTFEFLLNKPLIFDVDDAIWLGKPFGEKAATKIAKSSSCIIAGNQYIADWFSQHSSNVVVIPTAVDTKRYFPKQRKNYNDPFIIGWIGTSSNLRYLERIEGAVERFFQARPNSRLLVVCDKKPTLPRIKQSNILYAPWSVENEVRMIQNMDIGLMPLEDSEWVRGKCSFKMLQYMSCGKPVIVSPVGMNVEVMKKGDFGLFASSNNDWYQSLADFYDNEKERVEKGQKGRQIIKENYSSSVVTKLLSKTITKLV